MFKKLNFIKNTQPIIGQKSEEYLLKEYVDCKNNLKMKTFYFLRIKYVV